MPTILITRTFALSPDALWRAFTDPETLRAWFWPPSLNAEITADVTVGGQYRIASVPGDMAISGVFREVAPPRHLAMSWRWDGEDADSLVAVDFQPVDGGTEIRLQHRDLLDDQACAQHITGWNDCLDRLAPVMSHIG